MKGIRKFLPAILAVSLLCGCGTADTVRAGIGSLVLLEGRNPDYFEQLAPQKGFSFHIPEGLETSGRTKNLIFSSEHYMSHDGFTSVLNEDGSVTVSGVNEEKKVFLLVAGGVRLEAARYAVSDGGVSSEDGGFHLQVVGEKKALASLPGAKYFTLAEPQTVNVYIAVNAGTELHEVTFYPEISFIADEDDVYDPWPDAVLGASGSGSRALLFKTDREALKAFSDDDRILFDNNLFYMYRDRFEWVSLSFGDGTGVQVVGCDPDRAVYGKMDIYGRVYEAS